MHEYNCRPANPGRQIWLQLVGKKNQNLFFMIFNYYRFNFVFYSFSKMHCSSLLVNSDIGASGLIASLLERMMIKLGLSKMFDHWLYDQPQAFTLCALIPFTFKSSMYQQIK